MPPFLRSFTFRIFCVDATACSRSIDLDFCTVALAAHLRFVVLFILMVVKFSPVETCWLPLVSFEIRINLAARCLRARYWNLWVSWSLLRKYTTKAGFKRLKCQTVKEQFTSVRDHTDSSAEMNRPGWQNIWSDNLKTFPPARVQVKRHRSKTSNGKCMPPRQPHSFKADSSTKEVTENGLWMRRLRNSGAPVMSLVSRRWLQLHRYSWGDS